MTNIELKNKLYLEIIKDYNTGDFKLIDLAKKYKIRYDTISKNIRKRGIKTNPHGKINVNSNSFNSINTQEKAYWLGFLYADGNIHQNKKGYYGLELGLKESDLKHIEKFKSFLQSKHKIKYRKETKSYRIMFQDQVLCKDLIKLGCVPRKSLILTFPTEEQVPKEFQSHFIRGYFDGDGFIRKKSKNNNSININILGTFNFLKGLIVNITLNKINIIKKDKRHNNNTFFIDLSGQNARNFKEYIYKNANIFLERKKIISDEYNQEIYKKPVIQLDLNQNIIAEYYNGTEASKKTGISHTVISALCNNTYKYKSKYNFKFK